MRLLEQSWSLNEAADDAVAGSRSDLRVIWLEKVKYWLVDNPLRLHRELRELAAMPSVIATADAYLQRTAYLADVDFRKVMPVKMGELEKLGFSSSNWHRDNRGRQLKMMIYLSDVGEKDSCFSLFPEAISERTGERKCTAIRASQMKRPLSSAFHVSIGSAKPATRCCSIPTSCIA